MKTVAMVSILLTLCGCASRPAPQESGPLLETPWSRPVEGLQFMARMAAGPPGPDGRIPVELSVRNASETTIATTFRWSYGTGSFIPSIKVGGQRLGCYPLCTFESMPPPSSTYMMLHPAAEVSRFIVLDAKYLPRGQHELYFDVVMDNRIDTTGWTAAEIDRIVGAVWHGKQLTPIGPLPLDLTSCTNCGTGDSAVLRVLKEKAANK